MTGTRLRWIACAALAVVAVLLAGSLLFHHHPVAASNPGTPDPSSTADSTTTPTLGATDPTSSAAPTSAVPSPAVSTGPSADPSVDADADGGPPARPDATLGLSIGAAEALTHFYFEQAENYLKLTGDGRAVRTTASPGCSPCVAEIGIFVATNGRNKRLTGDYLWKNVEVRAVHSTGAHSAEVDVDLTRGKHAAVLTAGAKPTHYTGGTSRLVITLIASGNNWLVFDKELRVR